MDSHYIVRWAKLSPSKQGSHSLPSRRLPRGRAPPVVSHTGQRLPVGPVRFSPLSYAKSPSPKYILPNLLNELSW